MGAMNVCLFAHFLQIQQYDNGRVKFHSILFLCVLLYTFIQMPYCQLSLVMDFISIAFCFILSVCLCMCANANEKHHTINGFFSFLCFFNSLPTTFKTDCRHHHHHHDARWHTYLDFLFQMERTNECTQKKQQWLQGVCEC